MSSYVKIDENIPSTSNNSDIIFIANFKDSGVVSYINGVEYDYPGMFCDDPVDYDNCASSQGWHNLANIQDS